MLQQTSHVTAKLALRGLVGIALTLGVVAHPLTAQRGVRALTSSGTGHAEAKISPDGKWVAFRTSNNGVTALGVVGTAANSKEAILFTGQSLTGYLWRTDSVGLYFQDASTFNYVNAVGGKVKQIAKISGTNIRLQAVDAKNSFLIGARADSKSKQYVFTIATSGTASASDVISSTAVYFDGLVIDPRGKFLAYTAQSLGVPHAPTDVRMVGIDGKGDKSLSGGVLPRTGVNLSLPRKLGWIDSGKTLLFTAIDTGNIAWNVCRLTSTNSKVDFMTAHPQQHRGTSVARGLNSVVFIGSTFTFHDVPCVMSAMGGGRILLEPELNWQFSGDPTVSSSGQSVAFAGFKKTVPPSNKSAQIYLVTLDREIEITPRATLNTKINIKLPLEKNEVGSVYLSTGLLKNAAGPVLIKLPPLVYGVAIDPSLMLPLFGGVGDGSGSLSMVGTVPNLTALVGYTIYFQGLRVKPGKPETGDVTRYVELQFFK